MKLINEEAGHTPSSRRCRSEWAANQELAASRTAPPIISFPDYRHAQYERYARALLRERRSVAASAIHRRLIGWFIFLILLAAYGLMGSFNQQDLLREQQHYCDMVRSGAWPDFHHSSVSECPPKQEEILMKN